jgi:hypothetical protein
MRRAPSVIPLAVGRGHEGTVQHPAQQQLEDCLLNRARTPCSDGTPRRRRRHATDNVQRTARNCLVQPRSHAWQRGHERCNVRPAAPQAPHSDGRRRRATHNTARTRHHTHPNNMAHDAACIKHKTALRCDTPRGARRRTVCSDDRAVDVRAVVAVRHVRRTDAAQ